MCAVVGRHFGGYEVASYIGEGPTGAVYRAEDLTGAKMAIKVMHRELSQKAEVSLPLKQMPFGKVFGVLNPDGQRQYLLELSRTRPSRPVD